jgi:hypothetical protein
MGEQKNYTVGDKEVQLAPPTPARVSKILKLSGFSSFSETIQNDEKRNAFAGFLFDVQLDETKLAEMMSHCSLNSDGINWQDIDTRIIMGIITDFFSQLQSMNPAP